MDSPGYGSMLAVSPCGSPSRSTYLLTCYREKVTFGNYFSKIECYSMYYNTLLAFKGPFVSSFRLKILSNQYRKYLTLSELFTFGKYVWMFSVTIAGCLHY